MMKYTYIVILSIATVNITLAQSSNLLQPDLWLKKKPGIETRDLEKTGLLNFNEAYVFNGDGTYEEIPFNVDQASRFTFISVFHCLDSLAERAVWGSVNSSRSIMLSTQRVSGPKKIINYSASNTTVPILNTTIQYWGKSKGGEEPPAVWLGHPGEGHDDVQPFIGLIPEYMVFKRILREEQRQQVESYMAIKYGLTLHNSPYLSSETEITWNQVDNEQFANRIAGIGRDDFFELHQKQSASTERDNVLTIGATRITPTNKENESTLNNLDFLIWGDNGEAFEVASDAAQENSAFQLATRRWRLNSSGTTPHTISTQVVFDLSKLDIPPQYHPWLVINRSGDNTFKARDLEFIALAALTPSGEAVFNGVFWDTDQSGRDAFTIAIGPDQLPVVKSFDLFPNPSVGDYQIELSLQEPGEVAIEIYNIKGQLVKRMEGEGQEIYQFKDHLAEAGVYLVKVRTDEGSISKELIIID